MKFEPRNRHLLLEPTAKEEQEESTVLVPNDYSVPKSRYDLYKVVAVSIDCEKFNQDDVGKLVVVNNSTVEEIKVMNHIQYLMLENHVYGIFLE